MTSKWGTGFADPNGSTIVSLVRIGTIKDIYRFPSDRVLLIVSYMAPSLRCAFFIGGGSMSELILFSCPLTGRDVPVAVLQDQMLQDVQNQELEVACLECGKTHIWKIAEGRTTADDAVPMPKPARVA